ncbi:GNAT family N-acetyltransferase [Embleya sp. NPDC050154]|uniref:GNAT family N-acetyltransferase n=1 Tax=unclassified Embleya TaxID=2699296 RepID=UPI0037910374
MNDDDIVLRRADSADALPAADVWLRSFTTALPSVRRVHDEADVQAWFSHVLIPHQETWVALSHNTVVGLMVLKDTELKQLYLDPAWRGRGLGDRFMTLAKQQRPHGLTLRTFQINEPARRFYERHGFTETGRTDGQLNEEQEPDIRYDWKPRTRQPERNDQTRK